MKKIAVIGSLNVDYDAYVEKQPVMGETVLSRGFMIAPGGKGANQACAFGKLGADIYMFGCVGNDGNAALELASLQKNGVKTDYVQHAEGYTGIALITIDATGNNSIIVNQGANALVDRAYIDSVMPVLAQCDYAVFQLEIPMDTVIYTAEKMKQLGKTVILDPAPAPGRLPEELLKNVDYMKPNETELATLTGHEPSEDPAVIESMARELTDAGVGCVLASAGGNGVYVIRAGQAAEHYPAEKVQAVDTTAAGDCFTAAFVCGLSEGMEMAEAIAFAAKAAAISVTRPGAQDSIPTREEVMAAMEKKTFLPGKNTV